MHCMGAAHPRGHRTWKSSSWSRRAMSMRRLMPVSAAYHASLSDRPCIQAELVRVG